MEFLKELWNFIPNELKLLLGMSIPGSEGTIFIPTGIVGCGFSLMKTFLLCNTGTMIKISYYFFGIYGADYLVRKGLMSKEKFETWSEKKMSRTHSLARVGSGIGLAIIVSFCGLGFPCAVLSLIYAGVAFFRGFLIVSASASISNYLIAFGAFAYKDKLDAIWHRAGIAVDIFRILLS